MSLFLESLCKLGKNASVNLVSWSPLDPIAAVAATLNDDSGRPVYQITFINNEGEILSNTAITHDREATAMEWQPNGKIVGIGWADGSISCYAFDGRSRPTLTYTNSSQHRHAAITVLTWNPFGRRLVTGDKNGMVVVWTVDARGSLTSTRQYSGKSMITCAIFCMLTPKPEITRKADWKQTYSPPFFFGTINGLIVYADDLGHCMDVQTLSSSIDLMLFYEEKSRLVIITRSLYLTQYVVSPEAKVTKGLQVKLSVSQDAAEGGIQSVVWAGSGLLALATYERFVRFLDLNTDNGYNLSLSALGDVYEKSDKVAVVSFNPVDRYLAVGTLGGVVAIWRFHGNSKNGDSSSPSDWELYHFSSVRSSVTRIMWGYGQGTLAAAIGDGVAIMTETVLRQGMSGDLAIVQTSSDEVTVYVNGGQDSWVVKTGILVKGLAMGQSCFAVWNGKAVQVFQVDITLQKCEKCEVFAVNSNAVAVGDSNHITADAVFVAEQSVVRIMNFSGTQKELITFSEAEGYPKFLDLNDRYLAVLTDKGVIKLFDVHKPTQPKPQGSGGKFINAMGSDLSIRQISVNCKGTRVAILADHVEGALKIRNPDSKVFIYDKSKGATNVYDFAPQKRCPINVRWDPVDDRLFVCETISVRRPLTESEAKEKSDKERSDGQDAEQRAKLAAELDADLDNEVEISIFFATSDHGILPQDSFPRRYPHGTLLGIAVPKVYFRAAPPKYEEGSDTIIEPVPDGVYSKLMRHFVGLSDVDDDAKIALLDFSLNLALGKLDEAYRAVRRIDSAGVWENMAQMCVRTKRLDVADICLGHMGHARGAAALREAVANKQNSVEACVGILAIQLGLRDDAAKLFRECGRYDLLNKLFQAAGHWEKAVGVASSNDRIHLKTTHYHYAKHLESIGDINGAIQHYEFSGTARHEIPRMLYTYGRMDDLEDYVQQSEDITLMKWWAAYLESTERFDKARKGEFNVAAEIVQESEDKAAAYHFARQLEVQGELREAIAFYAKSGCFNHAIRLAKGYGLDAELMRFAIKATPSLMLDCASYYESKGELDKAVQLYHKGGDLPRALDLCFQAGANAGSDKSGKSAIVFDMLNTIAADLGAETSPQTLARCAEFLMTHRQYEKAIELYIMAKRYPQAIEMCIVHKVTMTDALIEKLTPPETWEANERKEILSALGNALKKAGNFFAASKKFTQAGDRIRAMKALLRGGDTKAIIQFASISRSEEIYKLAANYLQQMPWHENVDIMKAIITFYTKAKAFEHLAGFYDSCAQVEIDEYRDYEKALGAMLEAHKCLQKGQPNQYGQQMDLLEQRIDIMQKFVEARKAQAKDPEKMVRICDELLQDPNVDLTIRIGDCLAMMVEHYHRVHKLHEAYRYIQYMSSKGIELHPYIRADVIEEVFKAAGVDTSQQRRGSGGHAVAARTNDDDDDIEDEVEAAEEGQEELDEDLDDDDQPPQQQQQQYGRGYRK